MLMKPSLSYDDVNCQLSPYLAENILHFGLVMFPGPRLRLYVNCRLLRLSPFLMTRFYVLLLDIRIHISIDWETFNNFLPFFVLILFCSF